MDGATGVVRGKTLLKSRTTSTEGSQLSMKRDNERLHQADAGGLEEVLIISIGTVLSSV